MEAGPRHPGPLPADPGVEATLTPVGQDRGEAASEACELPEDRHSALRVGHRALKGGGRFRRPGVRMPVRAPPQPGTVPFAPGDGADRGLRGADPEPGCSLLLAAAHWRWPQGPWHPGLR